MGPIAAKRTGRPPGRRKGTRNTLVWGEVSAVELARKLCAELGEDSEATQLLYAALCAVARGDPGWRGRYVGDKLRALIHLLDRRKGKPVQPLEHKGTLTLEQLVRESISNPPDPPGPDRDGS